jgi:DNA polymerase III delta' subunit
MEWFSHLFGNEATKTRLALGIKNGTLPHAFLVTGGEGSGKRTLVREIAMALNCQDKSAPLPCHKCNNCQRIQSGNYTDIYTLKKDAQKASVGVEEVRLFKSSMMLSPVESEYKIYIIENAESLTVQAQNALLTFLEEPPKNTYIFLLAKSADGILTTVKSRTQAIAMQKFKRDELSSYLTGLSERAANLKMRDGDAFFGVVMNADGRIGRALSIIDDGGEGEISKSYALTEKIVSLALLESPFQELYPAMLDLPTERRKFISSLESLISALNDLVTLKFDAGAEPVFYKRREDALELSQKVSAGRIVKISEIILSAIDDATSNVGVGAIITHTATKIKLP